MSARLSSLFAGIALIGVVGAFWVPDVMGGPDVCRPGFARAQRLPPARYYPIAEEAYRRAGVPWSERRSHTLDHIVPLCLGGGWEQSNLQVQTKEDAALKDRVERYACRAYCKGEITTEDARRLIENWRNR